MVKRYRSLGERLMLYEEVMGLRGLGLCYKRIARIIEEKYGVSLNPGMICN
jgi:intein-encoded DNA endonuclease-like protein